MEAANSSENPVKKPNEIANLPLDRDRMERFHRLAPRTLERRDRAFYQRELVLGFEFLLTGAIAIAGALFFGWTALNWLLFLVVSAFTGILTDSIKLKCLHGPIHEHADHTADDQFVGLVCDALRKGEDEIPVLEHGGRYRPGAGLFFDLVFAPVSALLIGLLVVEDGVSNWSEVFGEPYFLPSLAGFFLFQIAQTAWQIASFRAGDSRSGPVKILLGGRGAGLFLLMFLVAMNGSCTEGRSEYTATLYTVNGALVLLGLVNTFGLLSIRNETRWLREYLEGTSKEKPSRRPGSFEA